MTANRTCESVGVYAFIRRLFAVSFFIVVPERGLRPTKRCESLV